MPSHQRSIVSVLFLIIALICGACSSEPKTPPKWIAVPVEQTHVSFDGDPTFIKARYVMDPRGLWFRAERFEFNGGIIDYYELAPGRGFTESGASHDKEFAAAEWERETYFTTRSGSATVNDVEFAASNSGRYSYIIKATNAGSCALAILPIAGFTAGLPASGGGMLGAHAYIEFKRCSAADDSAVQQAFVHNVLSRLRFDDGAQDRARGEAK